MMKEETVSNLFFECTVVRVVWEIMAQCVGANNIPSNLNQYRMWVKRCLPGGGGGGGCLGHLS
jgi:hypothetical protein